MPSSRHYQPYYCEENAWWLTRELSQEQPTSKVFAVFISNAERACLLAHQRAGGEGGLVVWDYHVMVLTLPLQGGALAWDLDTTLGFPVDAVRYVEATFAAAARRNRWLPRFRIVPAQRFLATFSTDRGHMRTEEGGWQRPPPPWDAPAVPGVGSNLNDFVDMERPFEGQVWELGPLLEWVRESAPRR